MERWGYDIPITDNIIGGQDNLYTFHKNDKWESLICKHVDTSDEQSIAWFRENYPADFAAGAQMKIHD